MYDSYSGHISVCCIQIVQAIVRCFLRQKTFQCDEGLANTSVPSRVWTHPRHLCHATFANVRDDFDDDGQLTGAFDAIESTCPSPSKSSSNLAKVTRVFAPSMEQTYSFSVPHRYIRERHRPTCRCSSGFRSCRATSTVDRTGSCQPSQGHRCGTLPVH